MKGRPIMGIVCGFLFGLSLALLLLTIGVLPLDSILVAALPVIFLIVGIVLAAAAPFKRSRLQRPTATPATVAAGAGTAPVASPPPAAEAPHESGRLQAGPTPDDDADG